MQLHKKRVFPLKISSVNVNTFSDFIDAIQKFFFIEEIFNEKLDFLCSDTTDKSKKSYNMDSFY